jgi:RNA polymerase sigma-70 factor (family 1)
MLSYVSYTDNELMALLKQGNDAAFSALYDRYWEKLFSIAGNKLNDLAMAEDIVQDIFLDLWYRRQQIVLSSALHSYLAVAVKYRVMDAQAKRYRGTQYAQYSRTHFSLEDHSTEQSISFEELKDRLALSITRLPDKCRLVYKLSREAGYSQKQIAEELNVSEKTVESHLFRAMKALRSALSHLSFLVL